MSMSNYGILERKKEGVRQVRGKKESPEKF